MHMQICQSWLKTFLKLDSHAYEFIKEGDVVRIYFMENNPDEAYAARKDWLTRKYLPAENSYNIPLIISAVLIIIGIYFFCRRFKITTADTIKSIPKPDMIVNGSENTTIPINVATMGSIVAIIPALLASTLSSPSVYARNGITAVIKAVRQQNIIRNIKSVVLENVLIILIG